MNRSKVRAAISWFFIIAAIVLIQFSIRYRTSGNVSADSAASIQIQISGKYFVGAKQIAGHNPMFEKNIAQFKQSIRSSQARKQLASIPILCELSGRDAALQELNLMADDPDSVADSSNIQAFLKLYRDGSASLDSDQVSVIKGYGWIGRLALSYDKPDSDTERQSVLKSASYTVLFLGLMTIAVLVVLLAGVTLFIIAIVRTIKGNIKSHLVMPESPGSLLIETFALYLILSSVLPLLIFFILPGFKNGGILMSVIAGFLPMLWPLFCGTGWKDYRTSLGWYRGKGFFREVGAGITGYITGLPLLVLAIYIVMILAKYFGVTPSHPVVFELRGPVLWILLACVYAPFVEETLFRGALYGYLRRYLSWVVSGIVSCLIFAILHPQGWVAVPAIGVIGFNLSVIREWRGSAIASMTAHALNNGSIMIMLILLLI